MYQYIRTSARQSQSILALLWFMISINFLLFLSRSDAAAAVAPAASTASYKNYTVGDSLGWYDKLENPKVDYQKWVADKTFSLGDFLIFNTDNNHSVIQTYNFTTYKSCDYQDSSNNDTIEWSSADPSSTSPHPISVPVPLLKVGLTYFFSGDYDGEQCQNGQQFSINVTYGHGLPKPSSDEAPAPVNPDSGNDDSAPDTLVPSSFDNPQNVSDDNEPSSKSTTTISNFFGVKFYGILILLGFYCTL